MSASRLPTSRASNAYSFLTRICTIIMEEPKRVAMGIVLMRGAGLDAWIRSHKRVAADHGTTMRRVYKPACNTVGCIAGWTDVLTGSANPNESNGSFYYEASQILGLDTNQREELFTPNDLVHAHNQQTKAHADAVVAHIKAFQAKYEDQLKATPITYKRRRRE